MLQLNIQNLSAEEKAIQFQYRKRYLRVATPLSDRRRAERIWSFNTASGIYVLQRPGLVEFGLQRVILFQYRKRYLRVATKEGAKQLRKEYGFNTASGIYVLQHVQTCLIKHIWLFQYRKRYLRVATEQSVRH